VTVDRGSLTQRGEGLIEVLIALVVVTLGLLGMAALQSRARLAEFESYQRVQALILLEDMANRMTANRPFRDCYDLSGADPSYLGTGASLAQTCNDRADADLRAWDALLDGAAETQGGNRTGAMLGARGCIRRVADNLFEISVVWQGLSSTVAPENNCAASPTTLYGDPARRRVVIRTIRYARLM
jgi:type IV pilus assembly protein PilV